MSVKLKHIVDTLGSELNNTEAVASLLGLRSSHHTRDIVNAWIKRLTSKDMEMLQDSFIETETPDGRNPLA